MGFHIPKEIWDGAVQQPPVHTHFPPICVQPCLGYWLKEHVSTWQVAGFMIQAAQSKFNKMEKQNK